MPETPNSPPAASLPDVDGGRGHLLDVLDESLAESVTKIRDGRVRDEQKDRVRVAQWRAVGYLADVKRRLLNDAEAAAVEELEERVEALEERVAPEDALALPDGGEHA